MNKSSEQWKLVDTTIGHDLKVGTFEMRIPEGKLFMVVMYDKQGQKIEKEVVFVPRDAGPLTMP